MRRGRGIKKIQLLEAQRNTAFLERGRRQPLYSSAQLFVTVPLKMPGDAAGNEKLKVWDQVL